MNMADGSHYSSDPDGGIVSPELNVPFSHHTVVISFATANGV